MLSSRWCRNGIVVTPHHLGAEAGIAVLREGGNAAEAAIAVAASLAVVYPHMTGIGGDSFWLLHDTDGTITGIDACGAAGADATPELYRANGLDAVPTRGPLAANTVAGTVGGWQAMLEAAGRWGGRIPPARLLADAIDQARSGTPMADSLAGLTLEAAGELDGVPGFADVFLRETARPGLPFRQERLAGTLQALVDAGFDGFYRGALAEAISADLAAVGAPVRASDLAAHRARVVDPLSLRLSVGEAYNMPPPTQGVASLMILGLYDRLRTGEEDDTALVHAIAQATTSAFRIRDAEVGDPAAMTTAPAGWLDDRWLAERAAGIDLSGVMRWGTGPDAGDTVWFGVIDGQGRAVSAIQSIYWEFGSGVVLPRTGILWQNRGSSLRLAGGGPRQLAPGRRPFHTLNPAMAKLNDGRLVVYGCMGGDGQPQTQAALMARYAWGGAPAQAAVTAPRWLLGRTWGEETAALRVERRFGATVPDRLRALGYPVTEVEAFDSVMGHAGLLARHPDGTLEGGADPRSDGTVATF